MKRNLKGEKIKMNESYEFFIAGSTRNKKKILEICDIFDKLSISYYCFLKNEQSNKLAGLDINDDGEKIANNFEKLELENNKVRIIFDYDMQGLKNSKNLLMVLPAGKSAHIESGVAYGLGKKCYAIGDYEKTDSLYLIFEKIFVDENELEKFLKEIR